MGRRPRKRDDYAQDAVTLLRIRRALLEDDERPAGWREPLAASLQQVAAAFVDNAARQEPIIKTRKGRS